LGQPTDAKGKHSSTGWGERRQTIVFLIVVACIIVVIALVGSLWSEEPDTTDYPVPAPPYDRLLD
jgi:hypothetical protein